MILVAASTDQPLGGRCQQGPSLPSGPFGIVELLLRGDDAVCLAAESEMGMYLYPNTRVGSGIRSDPEGSVRARELEPRAERAITRDRKRPIGVPWTREPPPLL